MSDNTPTHTPPPEGSAFADAFRKAMTPDAAPPQKPADSPPPPAPDKPAEPADDTPPEVKSEEGKKSWKTWKDEHAKILTAKEELEKTSSQLKSEIEKLTGELKTKLDPKELEAIKAEREELRLQLRLKDVQADPSWKTQIEQPLSKALETARANVPKELRVSIERLLLQPASDERLAAIDELVSDLSPLKQAAIANAIQQADEVLAKRERLLSDQKGLAERYEQFQKEESESRKQASERELATAIETIAKRAADPKEGFGFNEEEVGKLRQYAQADPDAATRSTLAAWAVQGQRSVGLLKEAAAEIERLKGQVAKLSSVTPGTSQVAAPPTQAKPKTFIEAFKEQLTG